ncbi:MAG TPA: cyclic nucleotide-binding domain-containing protein [Usitatibacteraceae bacterium]|nr:cyclic nucleotide-binding domain-containing protein [Usitatibacteraceae bacterium]
MKQPFLQALAPEAKDLLLAAARPVSFLRGTTLVRHGEIARGAFVLREGAAEARVFAPGGECIVVARLGAGDIFGEMALVEAGTCTATVVATANVDGWFLAFEDFRAVVLQRQRAARELQHAVTLVLAERLRALNQRLAALPSPEDRPMRAAGAGPLEGVTRSRRAAFDLPAFLPRLAFFDHFPANEIDEVVSAAHILEAPRGAMLHAPGSPAEAVFIVARGAVEVLRPVSGQERRVAVLGPGRPLGFMGVLLGTTHGSHAWVREDSTILEIPAEQFRGLYFGEGASGSRVRAAVQRSMLVSLGRTNRALTRLATHARLAERHGEAELLEAAGAAQFWTEKAPAPA